MRWQISIRQACDLRPRLLSLPRSSMQRGSRPPHCGRPVGSPVAVWKLLTGAARLGVAGAVRRQSRRSRRFRDLRSGRPASRRLLKPLTSPANGSTIGVADRARNRVLIACLRATVLTPGARPCSGQDRSQRGASIGTSLPGKDGPWLVRSLPLCLPESHSWLAFGASAAAR